MRKDESVRDVRFEKPTFIDPLTGLFNRYYLYEFLPQEIKKSQFSDYSLGIFIIDIDNFKDLNDKYGHLAGDDVLKQFSDLIKRTRRQTDMVIRYAGDEFMILLPGVDRDTGLSLGKRLIEKIAQAAFKTKDGAETHLTVSIGLALCPSDSNQTDKLIDLADKAMYLSKDKGKNHISHSGEVTLENAAFQLALDFFPCPKFIDRQTEMAQLKEVFENTVLGKGFSAPVFIYGETGTGKSRLLGEFNNYAQEKAVILAAKGAHKRQEEPYFLFAEAIDNYLSKIGPHSLQAQELISALPDEELAELAKLLPQIGSVKSSLAGKEARALLFKSMLDLLIAINSKNPLVLSFDNLQWADNASIELLHYLIKYERKRKIHVLLTLRGKPATDASAGRPSLGQKEKDALARLLDYLRHSENALEIPLSDFSERNTYEMIETMFPGLRELKEISASVFEVTKGNPGFIEEIFKSLVENKLLVYKDNSWQLAVGLEEIDIPDSLEETIKRRVRNLDKETKELIVQAAVIGEDFSVDLLKKLGESNEGYIFEVMARAQKRHLVKESEKVGNFNFINSGIQDVVYNELSDDERKSLHSKIGQMLVEEHSQDLYNVAADVSLHFGKAASGVLASQYGRLLQEKAADLFNPAEVIDYLKEFTSEAIKAPEEKEVKLELVTLTRLEVSRLIKLIQSAVKNCQLYPTGSSIRHNFVMDIHHSLELILKDTPRLEIIESENSLIINGRRFSLREIQELGEGDFISLMVESNIKSLSFTQGISEEEVSIFLDNFGRHRQAVTDKNMWKEIILRNKLSHLRIDEFSYEEIAAPASRDTGVRKKFEDAMMTEFLLGKISRDEMDKKSFFSKVSGEPQKFAAAINKIAESVEKREEIQSVIEGLKKITSQITTEHVGASEAIENLSKIIQELDWKLKTKFIRAKPKIAGLNKANITDELIARIPAGEIVNLIERNIREGADNPLVVKDLLNKVLPNAAKRQEVLPLVGAKLTELGMDKEVVDSLCGKASWEKLSIEKRLQAFVTLPEEELEALDIDILSSFMEELFHKKDTPALKSLMRAFIAKTLESEQEVAQKINQALKDFLKKDAYILERARALIELLAAETKRGVFAQTLEIIKNLIEDFMKGLEPHELYSVSQRPLRKDYAVFISETFNIMEKRFKSQNAEDASVHVTIKDFISSVLKVPNFLEMLVGIILDYFQAEPKRVRALLDTLGDASQEVLVDICLSGKKISKDSFEGYAMRKRVALVLREMGDAALNRLKRYFTQENKKENTLLLLELAGHLGKEELTELVEAFLYHDDLELRRQAVLALGAIGTKKTDDLLSALLAIEKNKEMQLLITKILSRKK